MVLDGGGGKSAPARFAVHYSGVRESCRRAVCLIRLYAGRRSKVVECDSRIDEERQCMSGKSIDSAALRFW
jgi:hypothetical protein